MGKPTGINALFTELRRRHVFRVAAVYAVGGWLLIQVVTQTFPVLLLPAWVTRAVVVLILIGFPISLVLAWALEITPEGVRRAGGAEAEPGTEPGRGRRRAVAIAAALLAVAGGLALDGRLPALLPGPAPAEAEAIRSIAVLPFVNMSSDQENEHFSSGMTEELLDELAQVRGLRVAARTSSFAFRGKDVDVREIGAKLGVESVLEGSVRKAGDRLRITAQLIDADSGYHLWSHTYERKLEDVFAIQEDISASIVRSLLPKLTVPAPSRDPGVDLPTYELYLRGKHRLENARSEADLREAMALLESAIARDPTYAPPHTALAEAHLSLPGRPRERAPQAKAAALRAIELDAEQSEAYFHLATIYYLYEWNYAAAEQAYLRSLELNPLFATSCGCYAVFLHGMGRQAEALREAERSRALDPMRVDAHSFLARMHLVERRYADAGASLRAAAEVDSLSVWIPVTASLLHADQGRREEALAELRRARELWARRVGPQAPLPPLAAAEIAYTYAALGEPAEARALLDQLKQRAGEGYTPSLPIAAVHAALGENDQALRWLEQAREEREWVGWLVAWVRWRPGAEALRRDARYQAFLEEIGYPPAGR